MQRGARRHLQCLDRSSDEPPEDLAIGVAEFEHAVEQSRRLDDRIRAVTIDHQVGGFGRRDVADLADGMLRDPFRLVDSTAARVS